MSEKTTCVIVGGGPAGMVAALLLARGGVDVTVLEKHGDFLRDFRGDTVHPSTLRLLDELGLFEQFDALPHTQLERMGIGPARRPFGERRRFHPVAHAASLHRHGAAVGPARPARRGREKAEPAFTLRMSHDVTGLLHESGRVVGVRYEGPDGPGELRADLTIACDGRWSLCRREGGLVPRDYPVHADVWWFRLPRARRYRRHVAAPVQRRLLVVMIPRKGYLQTGYYLPQRSRRPAAGAGTRGAAPRHRHGRSRTVRGVTASNRWTKSSF